MKTSSSVLWAIRISGTLSASFKHLVQYTLERIVLECCSYSFFVGQLLVDLVILAVGSLLNHDINAIIWRQGLLETYSNTQAQNRRQRTMRDRRSNLHQYPSKCMRVRIC